MSLAIVILAAGEGTRFKSDLPKVLHPLAGAPIVTYPLAIAAELHAKKTVLVVGPNGRKLLQPSLNGHPSSIVWATQHRPLGTAHAVLSAMSALRGFHGQVLILAGDVPLMRGETLKTFVTAVGASHAPGGVLTVLQPNPQGYGRIVRDLDDTVRAIVEERDADEETRAIREINTGVFCCDAQWLFRTLKKVKSQNAQREFYLTDIAAMATAEGRGLLPVCAKDPEEFMGINTRIQLADAEAIMRRRIVETWMLGGVTFHDPRTAYVDRAVQIGRDTTIGPHVSLRGQTVIGQACHIDAGVVIRESRIGHHVTIKPYSVIDEAQIGAACEIGPFARLRPATRLDAEVRVGNFVETKKVWLKKGVKANHLTYLGDATIGARTNVGCGTITCNYDGKKKYETIIGEGVFIGSDTQLVAPVRIGKGAITGAGSVITENVPAGALAIARGRQVNKRQKR